MAGLYTQELIALADGGVRFVVAGAVALGLHNYPRATADLDILPSLDPENLKKIVGIMAALGFKPRVPVDPLEMLDPAKRQAWHEEKHLMVFTFYLDARPPHLIDVMIYPPITYEACAARQQTVTVEGRAIAVAGLKDLLFMKKSAMRPKDLTDIAVLEKLVDFEETK